MALAHSSSTPDPWLASKKQSSQSKETKGHTPLGGNPQPEGQENINLSDISGRGGGQARVELGKVPSRTPGPPGPLWDPVHSRLGWRRAVDRLIPFKKTTTNLVFEAQRQECTNPELHGSRQTFLYQNQARSQEKMLLGDHGEY